MKKNFKDKINTQGFDKNKQNINRTGANRKLVSSVIIEFDKNGIEAVTNAQIKGVFERMLNLTASELAAITKDEKQPMLNRIVAKNMLDKKGFEIIEKMLDRVHGKALQKSDITTDGKELNKTEIIVQNAEAAEALKKLINDNK